MAVDLLGDFLVVLESALDDHEATAGDLASRMHLSRFHLDRLISQAAGEPPARLRRRLLLERAAFQLATSDLSVAEAAIGAGYGSHEAFTRAFVTAFGSSPSTWRARPAEVTIPAANGIHFHPPAGIRFPARDQETSMDLVVRMVEHHLWLTGELVNRAERLTATQLDAAIPYGLEDDPEAMTIRRLLSRLVGQLNMWNAALANGSYDLGVEDHESLVSVRRRLDDHGPRFLAHLRKACQDGALGDLFVEALFEKPAVFTYGGMIAHVLTFAAHRRTLVVRALAAHGIDDLGWGDPMSWVAGEVGTRVQ